ncbi:MAG: hypothetical protein JXR59_10730 [Desulfuromonadaceae bacterium]|nr:hypothetical protein [Desulfuromonadaceae bacterium]
MHSTTLDQLQQPFAASDIKQRSGSYGKTLHYLEGHSVIARLNQAFEGDWDCRIRQHWISSEADEVLAKVELRAGGTVKQGIGSAHIKRQRDSGAIIDLGSDLKAACTDGIKKAATLLGIGLYLYAEGEVDPEFCTASCASPPASASIALPRSGLDPAPQSRLSAKQHNYLLNLAEKLGMNKQQLSSHCQGRYQRVVDHLTREQASELIEDFHQHRITVEQAA